MHVQARAVPASSPTDLITFLKVLAGVEPEADPINIEGVTGSGIETGIETGIENGGHFNFTIEEGREQETHDRLTAQGYQCQWTNELHAERIPRDAPPDAAQDPNKPGVLLGIVERARGSGLAGGRPINEILIGAFTREPNVFYAQVTFVGAKWENTVPTDRVGKYS